MCVFGGGGGGEVAVLCADWCSGKIASVKGGQRQACSKQLQQEIKETSAFVLAHGSSSSRFCKCRTDPHLPKIALKGTIEGLWFAAQNCGCMVTGHSQRVATMHPVIARLVFMDPATSCGCPSRALLHDCNMYHALFLHTFAM